MDRRIGQRWSPQRAAAGTSFGVGNQGAAGRAGVGARRSVRSQPAPCCAWPLALRDEAWVPDDPGVDRAHADAIVRAALALRPGAFDRDLDPATLREVVRLELVGGERPQTLALYAGTDEETWWVRSTRAAGLAKVHHLDALALEKQLAELE